jgi:hypothetical protein
MISAKHRLVRIVLSGLNDIEEWRLGDETLARAKGYPREYSADVIDDWGIVFVDLVLDAATGRPHCHEVNGPNAVGSDALTGDSHLRAESEARQALQRCRERGYLGSDGRLRTPVATVHAHQHWRAFRTGGEFFPRVDDFAERLEQRLGAGAVALRSAGEPLGEEPLSVVLGDVPAVAAHLHVDPRARRLLYRGRPVVFVGNPNLVPELVRTGQVRPGRAGAGDLDLRVFHAWRLVHLVHEKGRQQDLLQGTGIERLSYFEADSLEAARVRARALLTQGPVVLKPNGASGGTGVHVVTPGMSDAELDARAARGHRGLRGQVRGQRRGRRVPHPGLSVRAFHRLPDGGRRAPLGSPDRRAVRAGPRPRVSGLDAHRAAAVRCRELPPRPRPVDLQRERPPRDPAQVRHGRRGARHRRHDARGASSARSAPACGGL